MAHFSDTLGNTTDAYLDLQDRLKDDCVTAGMTFVETVTTGNFVGHILSSVGTTNTSETNWYLGIITNTEDPNRVRLTVAEGWNTSTKTFSAFVPNTNASGAGSDTAGGNRAADSTANYTTALSPAAINSAELGYLYLETRDLGYRYELNVSPDRIVAASKTDTGTSILKFAIYAGLMKPAEVPVPPAGSEVQLGIGWLKAVDGFLSNILGTSTFNLETNRRYPTLGYQRSQPTSTNDDNRSISFAFTRDPNQGVRSNWLNGAFMGAIARYGGSVGYTPIAPFADGINTEFFVPNEITVFGANGIPSASGTRHTTMMSNPRGYLLECTLVDGASSETGHTIEIDGFVYYNMNMNNSLTSIYVKGEAVGS